MCLPAIAIAGVAMQAASQYQKGQAEGKAAKYNAEQNDYNAQLAVGRSADALERGNKVAGQIGMDTARTVGEGHAGFAAGNVDLSSQSVKYWELDTVSAGAQDQATARYNAGQESKGLQAEGYNARATSRLARAQGRSAVNAGYLGAGSSLLAGASETAYRFRDTSAPKSKTTQSWY